MLPEMMTFLLVATCVSSNTWSQVEKKSEEVLLDGLLPEEEVDCFGKKCLSSDQCCRGSVCVDVDGSKPGTCLPIYGQREGEQCQRDSDCEQGLRCLASTGRARICKLRELRKKQFNDECQSSDECDKSKGLCCQLQRRHRMAPRKVCYYFADPKACIGSVADYRPSLYRPYKSLSFFHNPLFKARMG
ncbi:prohormone-3-like isoform X2 [Ornithodoros turicata]|uniref:prohormone-3-like isoform X2 n=1 Tax=Ornithodoros turicata TaxID=34597 RepID=UPI0031389F9D